MRDINLIVEVKVVQLKNKNPVPGHRQPFPQRCGINRQPSQQSLCPQ